MSLSWSDSTANVFQEVTATITTSGSDARAIYVDWGDGQDPDGNFTHDKRYANYQWITSTEATGSFTAKHTYTATGTFYPVIQVINSDGLASKYYAHTGATGVPQPTFVTGTTTGTTTITGNVVSDTAATAIMRTQNKQVKSGIDNSYLEEFGANLIYISIPPLATATQLSYVNSITVEVEGIVQSTMNDTGSAATTVAGGGRFIKTVSKTVGSTFGPGYTEVDPGDGNQWVKILKATWVNPKLASNHNDYARNEAYNLVKVFLLLKGKDDNYYPITYLSAGSPIKKADDPSRNIVMDFTQSRAAASNVELNKYRYDLGKVWFQPAFEWESILTDDYQYFTDKTVTTAPTKKVAYTYMTNPIGLDGDSDPDKTAWGTGTTALDWNIDASDDQRVRTNQFLIDEYGCFFPTYHFTRLSVQPSSSTTLTGTSVSSIYSNSPFVLRVTPAGLSTMNRTTSGSFTKLDVAPLSSGNYSADYSRESFKNGSSNVISLDAVNTQTWNTIEGQTRTDHEYLIALFKNKTNKIGFNLSPYGSDLISRALSGSAPTNPITITVSYLHVDHFETPRQNVYWKELETVDATKIEWEVRNTTSGAYFDHSTSLAKSGFISFDMPENWQRLSMDDLVGGYDTANPPQGFYGAQPNLTNIEVGGSLGSNEFFITGTAHHDNTGGAMEVADYGNFIELSSLTGDKVTGGAIDEDVIGSVDEAGAFKYLAVCLTGAGVSNTNITAGWVASGSANGIKSDRTKLYIHYGEADGSNWSLFNNTAGTKWLIKRVNIYDAFTGASKIEIGPSDNFSFKPPVDWKGVQGASVFRNYYMFKDPQDPSVTAAGTISSGATFNWAQMNIGGGAVAAKNERKYAIKISISGTAEDSNGLDIYNIWDATEGHVNVIEQIDDSAYNLNSIPLTASVGVGRASNLYTAITRKGKVFIAQTGIPIQTIGFTSVALGDENNSSAFSLNGPGSTYGYLHKIRKLQANGKRVYWDEKQKDGTFVRFWGVIQNVDESREVGGPRAVMNYSFELIVENIALLENDGKLMTDIFPLGGVIDDKTYT